MHGPCQTRSVVVRMLDPLIVAYVVARKRCAVSLAFDVVCYCRVHSLTTKLSS